MCDVRLFGWSAYTNITEPKRHTHTNKRQIEMSIWNLNMFFFVFSSRLLFIPLRGGVKRRWECNDQLQYESTEIFYVEIHVFDRFSLSEFLINVIFFSMNPIFLIAASSCHHCDRFDHRLVARLIFTTNVYILIYAMTGTCRVSPNNFLLWIGYLCRRCSCVRTLFHISFTSANIAIAPDITREKRRKKNVSFEQLQP